MGNTETTDDGVAANSGWPVSDSDLQAGDVRDSEIATDVHGEPTRLVQLPTGPTDDRDPGVPPACSFCNDDTHMREREGEALKNALSDGENVEVRYEKGGRPHFGQVVALRTGANTYTHPDCGLSFDPWESDGWMVVVSPFTDAGHHSVLLDEARIITHPWPDDVGIIRADYAVMGTQTGEILGYGCHACVQE